MKDFYINITSQEESYDYSYITSNYSNITSDDDYIENIVFIRVVVSYIIIGVGLPLTLVAIYALYSQDDDLTRFLEEASTMDPRFKETINKEDVFPRLIDAVVRLVSESEVQNDHVAPIYVINLLISDLIQLCCMIVWVATTADQMINIIFSSIHLYCLIASIGFMVCVALERYLVITCPLWYRFRRTIKISVVVCVLVWIFPLVYILIFLFWVHFDTLLIIFGVFLLLPLPLFIFFLGGTLKALSASHVPSDEKRRIVGVLVLVLLIYTLLFLPIIIYFLSKGDLYNITLSSVSYICVQLSSLADLTLYVFMRKGIIDKLLSSVCCCRMDSNDINSPSV